MHTYPQTHFERLVHTNIADCESLSPRVRPLLETPYHQAYPGWEEITEERFVRGGFFTHRLYALQFKQVTIPSSNGQLAARAFILSDGTGYALVQDYWKGKLRYYMFGCQHDMTITNVGRCLNRHTCKICGYSVEIDSSD